MFKGMNSRKQGDVGLGLAIGHFAARGFTVCVPLTDNQDYDLVVDESGELKKVQVKTSKQRNDNGSYEVNLRVKGGNQSWSGVTKFFDPKVVDYLFVVTENGDQYLIPASKVTSKSSITVGWDKYNEYKI